MEGSLKELAGYRLERAKEMLSASESNLEIGQYKTSLNRAYYAVFHAMRYMTCFTCKGDMEKSLTTYMAECDGYFPIIKNVPCSKCAQCGKEYLNGVTLQRNSGGRQNITDCKTL